MRVLFGDSELAPWRFDVLHALRLFLHHGSEAARALDLAESESVAMRERLLHAKDALTHLVRFTSEVEASVETISLTAEHDEARAFAAELLDHARVRAHERAEQVRASVKRANAQSADTMRVAEERAREELRTYLLQDDIGGAFDAITLRLDQGCYRVAVSQRIDGVLVDYTLSQGGLESWREPRRLSSISDDLEQLQIGMKKKLFRRDMTREMMRVGDHYLLAARIYPDRASVDIAKRVDGSKAPLRLELEREPDGVYAHIERTESDGAHLFPAIPSDVEKLAGLWGALQRVGLDALGVRVGVEAARLDNRDLLTDDPGALIDHLVSHFAPRVVEIARRSPSPKELSLKIEHGDGRREERYLDRGLIRALLEDLPPGARSRLEALDP